MIVSILVWFIVVLVLIFLLRGIVKKCMEWSEPPVSRRIIIRRAGGESTIYTINPNQLQPGAVIHYQSGGPPPDYRTEILFAPPSTDSLMKTDKDLPTYEEVIRQSLENVTENPNNTIDSNTSNNNTNSNPNTNSSSNLNTNNNNNNINSNSNNNNNSISDNNNNTNNNNTNNSNNNADIRNREPPTTEPR